MAFNEAQKEAILHGSKDEEKDQHLMIVSAAGSGKSTTLIGKAVKMVNDGKRNILAISFTRNTADDLTRKLKLAKVDSFVEVGTFHSICGNILKREGYYTLSKRLKGYEIENRFKKILVNEKKIDLEGIMSFISFQKNNMRSYTDDFVAKECIYNEVQLRECFQAYEELKAENEAYDFDDYLLLGYKVLSENPDKYVYDYLLLDEAQDSNEIQWNIVDLLCPKGQITIFGDAQQSLYQFRGAKPELFMDFYKSHENTHVVNMNINYRSNIEIVERANHFIKQYYGEYKYYSDSVPNSEDHADIELMVSDMPELEACEVVDKIETLLGLGYKGNEIAILFRNNIQSQNIENELRMRDIDYYIESDGGFFNRKEIDIIMCILRMIDNHEDDSAFETLFRYRIEPFTFLSNAVLNDIIQLSGENKISHLEASTTIRCMPWQQQKLRWFKSAIAKLTTQHNNGYNLLQIITNTIETFGLENYIKTNYPNPEDSQDRLTSLENLKKFIRSNTLDSFLKFVYEANTGGTKENSESKVQLMTIHKAKGLQWKATFVVGLQQGKFPSDKTLIEEECNVFYVACTRPVEKLFLSQIGEYNQFCEEYFGKEYQKLVDEAN